MIYYNRDFNLSLIIIDYNFRGIFATEEGEQHRVCRSYRVLSETYQSKGEIEKAIHHNEVAREIASSFNWHVQLFWTHYNLARLFRNQGRFDDAQTHVERAKSHTGNDAYHLGHATKEQAWIWYGQHRLEEARSEVLRAADLYEKLGAATDVEDCRKLLRDIEEELGTPVTSGQSGFNCELL